MMARGEVEAKGLFVAFLLFSFHIWSSSGSLAGFSYDVKQGSPKSCSPKERLSFLQKHKVSSSQFRVFLSNPEAFLDSLSSTQIPVDFFLNLIRSKSLAESEQKKLTWQEEVIFPTSRRQLLDEKFVTIHDTVSPITVPSTNPSIGIVTVPSTTPTTDLPITSPITVPSTNPTTTPITFPSTNPTTAPITVPATNPVTNPVSNPTTSPVTNPTTSPVTNPTTAPVTVPPAVPVTNPVTTPTTNPVNQPVTNPTTYPFPPPSLVPPITGTPNTVPVAPAAGTPATGTPTGSGQSWCVARSGVTEVELQNALDYACGIGGADCSAIQMSGSCYNPNSLQAHASYAFSSYYQKNPVPTSCDFGGAAMLVTTNPSTGACVFPSSSSSASSVNPGLNPGLNPASGTNTGIGSTGIGTGPTGIAPTNYGSSSGSGSSVFNTNSSTGSNTVFGSDSPTGTISISSFCRPRCWILFVLMLAVNLQLLQ